MQKAEIEELQNQSVAEITEVLPQLDREDVLTLQSLESLQDAPRSTLMKAIEKRLAELDPAGDTNQNANDEPVVVGEGEAPSAEAAAPAAEDPAAEVTPAKPEPWKEPAYVGPLSGDQAAWRNAHLKPADLGRIERVDITAAKRK